MALTWTTNFEYCGVTVWKKEELMCRRSRWTVMDWLLLVLVRACNVILLLIRSVLCSKDCYLKSVLEDMLSFTMQIDPFLGKSD